MDERLKTHLTLEYLQEMVDVVRLHSRAVTEVYMKRHDSDLVEDNETLRSLVRTEIMCKGMLLDLLGEDNDR